MENHQNPELGGGPKPSRNYRMSPEALIAKMKLVFSNAREPEILSELQTVGITEARLQTYLAAVENLEALDQQQGKEYGEQYDATDDFNQKLQEIDGRYTRHRNLALIAFKKNRQAYTTLGIHQPKKRAYAAWLQQVKNFYAQILANPEFKAKAATISITENEITNQMEALKELEALKNSQKKETGEAQKATETRDEALDALYPEYRELVEYATELFQDDQTLEKLGIVVKREG